MSPSHEEIVEALRNSLKEREQLREENRRLAAKDREPIAIVGMSGRFPGGVRSPDDLWRLLVTETDAISELPTDRGWDLDRLYDPDPDARGTVYVRHGGFVDGVADFDADFFGISPHEALAMDPQQRAMLEEAWTAIESAGIDPTELAGTPTGVFVGASVTDYAGRLAARVEGYRMVGSLPSVISGRIAYALGLEGPAVTLDTACSASLVATHEACQALRRGETSLALAGGVTIMATPWLMVEFSRQRGLARDGRCKSFAESADGTGLSDGAGVLVLERLSDARRNGHRVLAVIRGSAVNQDGASNGLTAPNGPSQERVIREALAAADLSPADVDAVEAHGTGTTLGDPIEAQALMAIYGQERANGPLHVGSIKSNIGHTSAAAGVAGIMKMVLALREELLPRTLHADEPSSHIDWSEGEVELLTEARPWPRGERPRRAGVSSFAISGTNAHMLLEEAPEAEEAAPGASEASEPPAVAWVVSATSEPAIRAQARQLRAHVEERPELAPLDVAFSLVTGRARLPHSAAAIGSDRDALLAGLDALERGERPAGVAGGELHRGKTAFLFTGQGAQRAGMGRGLAAAFPAFAGALDEVCAELDRHTGRPLRELMFAEPGSDEAGLLDRTEFTQTALFALEVALYRLVESLGTKADFLAGHSIGELVAAHVAGVLSLADACALVAARGRLMEALPEGGGMLAIRAEEEEVAETLAGFEGRLSIAAVNGPRAVVVSGDADALDELEPVWAERGRDTKRLRVSHAFHSPRVEPMLDEFRKVAEGLSFAVPRIPIVSALTGERVAAEEIATPDFWVRHVREPVRFADAVAALDGAGVTRFLELGPDGVLSAMAGESLGPERAVLVPALRAERDEGEAFAAFLAAAHSAGVAVRWPAFFEGRGARLVDLPTYAFQRERYWLETAGGPDDLAAAGQLPAEHPLLGAAVRLAVDEGWLFTGRLSLRTHPWLADHAVMDTVLLPGTAFVELALAAAERVGAGGIEELTLVAPLVVEGERALQVTVAGPGEDGRRAIEVYSRPQEGAGDEPGEEEWTQHASGTLGAGDAEAADEGLATFAAASWPPDGAEEVDVELLYDRLAEAGYDYGPAFQGLRRAYRTGDALFAEVALDGERESDAAGFRVHPALADAALHAMLHAQLDGRDADAPPEVPFTFSGVRLARAGAAALRVRLERGDDGEGDGATVRLQAIDESGASAFAVEAIEVRRVDPAALGAQARPGRDGLFTLQWVEVEDSGPASTAGSAPRATLLGEDDGALAGSRIDLESHPDLAALERAIADGAPAPEAVLVRAGGADGPLAGAVHELTERTLGLLQAWLASEALAEARLVVVTDGALAMGAGESPNLAQAALVGLMRSAHSENPGRFALVDIHGTDASATGLHGALESEEPELALRDGVLYAPRLARAGGLVPPAEAPAWRLAIERTGSLEDLALVPSEAAEAPLADGEVRLAMRAAGLNFRDVLIALGMYPGEAPLGSEGAGVVVEVGPGVEDLAPGDRVMGLVGEAFGSHAIGDQRMLVPIPAGWSYAEAAAVPTVFLTAYYGLLDIGGLREGQAVLVHAGAGGVGMAAIQIARHLGAEVYATASPAKWDVLRGLGLDDRHIASSRDLDFGERFLEANGGKGVDVVLNSLAREFVDASLELLPRGGRFVEIGKADIRDPEQVAAGHEGVEYRAFDLLEAGPERIQEMLAELVELFERGVLSHPPISSWDVRRSPDAFRHMREGRHVGKIVLSVSQPPDPDGTILITGATGGLGALVARHLAAEHGARRLLLTSRRGAAADGAEELVAALAEFGCQAGVAACDVADREQVEALLAEIPEEHPLTAVVHAAGVLDDGVIGSLDGDRLKRVMAPKVDGAINLHELTKDAELAQFVLFSSIAGTLGSPGQANYSAANTFLDALARERHGSGLPATSLAWGAWERGMGGDLDDAGGAQGQRMGMTALSDEDGLALFDAARDAGDPLLAPVRLDTAALRIRARDGLLPPILSSLAPAQPGRPRASAGSLARRLAQLPEGEWEEAVLELVRRDVASVIGHASPDQVDPKRSFKELGFDSLAAVELRNRLTQTTGLRLSSTLVFDHPTVEAVARFVRSEVSGAEGLEPARPRVPAHSDEPIAIVGMSCRYPGGVSSPDELWELVASGTDAISGFPDDRGWDLERLYDPDPDKPGTVYTRHGGFLYDAADFDAGFFGIGPSEALAMDPQQRLMLEAAWDAFQSAGIDPASLRETETGVFAGAADTDYRERVGEAYEAFRLTGTTMSVLSGRLAHMFGLQGPAMTVDTACSSSLVAMHLACQSLLRGESSLALAGGVSVMAAPDLFIEFARQRGLASDGRCKSYGAAADGTGFSDGLGVLVLERLSDARRNGHRVLAVIRGSAVNQDGPSNGLTAPNGPSQERVIRQALTSAGLSPADVDAVEGHGTGTTLGDPIEAQVLLATYGQERSNGPLRLGSIKSNIGHTSAGAGVAGVIKMVEAMRHGLLPPTLHADEPSPHVDWSAGQVELLRQPVEWPAGERPRRAAVSSFGISGTNAHVILEEAPAEEKEPVERSELPALPLLVSAHRETALRAQAERLRAWLAERPELEPLDVAFTLATARARLERRAAAVGGDREELLAALEALGRGESATGTPLDGKTAFLFTGQGAQWPGMGAELYEHFPVFREALDAVCSELDGHLGRSLRELMFAAEGSSEAELLDRTEFTQAALFALEVALYRLFETWGLRADYLIGHSIGELVAAHVAGVLSLADACTLVAARGRLMGALPEGGGMLAIKASEDEVAETLARFEDRLAIAAVNGPRAIVVSGEADALDELEPVWAERGTDTKRLRVSHAFHSHLMDPMLDEFRSVAEGLEFAEPRIEIVSNLTGGVVADELRDPGYWVRHVREAVRFADGVAALEQLGVTRYAELGPDGVLTALARLAAGEELGEHGLFAPAMRAGHEQVPTLVGCLGALDVAGAELDWGAFFEGSGARLVDLPTYAFQRERYWLETTGGAGDLAAAGQLPAEHPLLGAAVRLAGEEQGWLFTGRLSLRTHPWLSDHAVMDTVLLPGTAFVELALATAERAGAGGVEELTLVAPLVIDRELALQVTVGAPDEDGRRPVGVYSRPQEGAGDDGDPDWTLHASGMLGAGDAEAAGEALAAFAAASWPPEGAEEVDVELLYDRLAKAGYDYGPAFQGLRRAYRTGDALFAEVALDGEADGFRLHPALFDAALHTMLLERGAGDGAPPAVPFAFSGVRLARAGTAALRVRIETSDEADGGATTIGLQALDESGAPAFAVEALEARPVDPAALKAQAGAGEDSLFAVEWVEVEGAGSAGQSAASNGSGPAPGDGSAPRGALLGEDDDALAGGGLDLESHPDVAALERAIADGQAAPEVVLVRAGGAGGPLAGAVHDLTERMLGLLQAWLASEPLAGARLVVVTDGALAVGAGESPNLAQAALVGLMRSAHSENPGRFALVDIDGTDASAASLHGALASEEPELALREGVLHAPRLARAGGLTAPAEAGAWRLAIERTGSLEDLALVPSEAAEAPLADGEVRVAVRAAGLNFRDVLIALGMYPGEAPLGSEGAGVVVEVGPGVERLSPGDRVMGFLGEAFGSHAIGDQRTLVPIPAGWSYAEAAAVPTVFLTAYYALVDLAELQRGERLLVHGAAGGVGMAAVQLARHLGAEVYATASPAKWEAVGRLGVGDDRIASSRELDFRERFLEATSGEGMDVVLDSLTGEFVDASLELLPRGGRFVEIGKADVRDPEAVAGEHKGVEYRAFDLIEAGPERIQEMLAEVVELFERGVLSHPPIQSWDVRNAPDAFRYMREARHVGKIVLSVPQPPDPDGTILITGATGGLGALVARHLAERGARHLLLTSRRGAAAEGAEELVASLEELGCQARVAACDVAEREQVEALLAEIPEEHPLTAVVHAAGVLADGVIGSLDGDRLKRVMAPKVDGAINLHELTKDAELAQFVLFSSIAGTLGSPGQGNYSAANAFLDALARERHGRGLPASSLVWGAWEQAGGMAGDRPAADKERIRRLGAELLTNDEGLALFDAALRSHEPAPVLVRLDTAALRAQARDRALPPILSGLVRARAERVRDDTGSLQRRLSEVPESKWAEIVLDTVRDQVASVRGLESRDAVKPDLPFKDMGFDSLAAVELRNGLTRSTGIRLPATLVFDHPTPAAVAEHMLGQLPRADTGRPAIEEEFDRIERVLRESTADEETRRRVEARVRAFNTRVHSFLTGSRDAEDGEPVEDLESVSNEEIFALIDKEIGAS